MPRLTARITMTDHPTDPHDCLQTIDLVDQAGEVVAHVATTEGVTTAPEDHLDTVQAWIDHTGVPAEATIGPAGTVIVTPIT